MQNRIELEEIRGKCRARYKLEGTIKEYSEKIFELYKVDLVQILLNAETLEPHDFLKVYTLEELNEVLNNKVISSLLFRCWRNEEYFEILLDSSLDSLTVIADEELLKKVEKEL